MRLAQQLVGSAVARTRAGHFVHALVELLHARGPALSCSSVIAERGVQLLRQFLHVRHGCHQAAQHAHVVVGLSLLHRGSGCQGGRPVE
eukprot:3057270-Pyramimonas_sp.AAC.1